MAEVVDLHLGDEADRQAVYETDDIQIMRIRLKSGEALPTHRANSNVLLLPLQGVVTVQTEGHEVTAEVGKAIQVTYNTKMDVGNHSPSATTFLVLKTPHPRQMTQ